MKLIPGLLDKKVKITAIVITKEKTNIVCIIQRSIFHEV